MLNKFISGALDKVNPMDWANTITSSKLDRENYDLTRQSLALSAEALQAQKAQQAFQNEMYLENRDYERALQQQIFDREDTAMTRSVQDHVNAGFSPLAALGSAFGAGQVVSTSTAPNNQVQNNQFQNHNTNYFSDALNSMMERQDSAMSRALTMAMQTRELTASKERQDAEFQHSEELENIRYNNEKMLLEIQQNNLKEINDIQAQYKLNEITASNEGQKAIQQMIIEAQAKLQSNQQEWEASQPKSRSWDQIVETGLNYLKSSSPEFAQFVDENAQGWEIAFSFFYNILSDSSRSIEGKLQNFDNSPSNPFQYGTP